MNTPISSYSDSHFVLQLLPPVRQLPYEQEELLLRQIANGQLHAVNETLNGLLGYVLLSGKHNLLESLSRILEITSVLTRCLIENGADDTTLEEFLKIAYKTKEQFMTYEEVCNCSQKLAVYLIHYLQKPNTLSNTEAAVCQARGYTTRHYASKITLSEVANYVHLNSAYFSSIFKQIYGISFKEFLNRIRIENSMKLLRETNLDIIDISVRTGFEDQSYFTRIFKKYTDMTPKQYAHFRARADLRSN